MDGFGPGRRQVLQAGAVLAAGGLLGCDPTDDGGAGPSGDEAEADKALEALATVELTPAATLPPGVTRTFLSPELWGNRLQYWRLAGGRVECVRSAPVRTVGVLSRTLAPARASGRITVRTGTLAEGKGWSGFLVGAGAGELDPRAAALVQAAGGQGGGLLCLYEADGVVRFRDHTEESRTGTFPPLRTTGVTGPRQPRSRAEDVLLTLDIVPGAGATCVLALAAADARSGELLSRARSAPVAAAMVDGGLSLVSGSPRRTARHWFADLATSTSGKVVAQDLRIGPVLGTTFSLASGVLKLSAQLMPVGDDEPREVLLQTRRGEGTEWADVATARLSDGFTAVFRVTGWDATRPAAYRVVWAAGTDQEAAYEGSVPAEPTGPAPLKVAMVTCTLHAYRALDGASKDDPAFPGATKLGLYTERNLYFPYAPLVAGIRTQQPDLLVAMGDQYYETSVGAIDRESLALDALYKYALWLLSFRELTRDVPTVVLTDDHDVFHRNLWGWAGVASPDGDELYGGYAFPPDWVDLVQHMQCGHNPDPYDATPIAQGIDVYYTAFSYGGVSFAALEDRKFKNTNQYGEDPSGTPLPEPRDLLGARQERFLSSWASMHPGQPKVCLTQTLFGTLQTDENGAAVKDPDSNGAPAAARSRAVELLARARAVVLSGDQHLASLVRHHVTGSSAEVVQFTAPAAGSHWQRWFEPAGLLAAGGSTAAGEWKDFYGNPMTVLAVANPKISFGAYRAVKPTGGHHLGDRGLKREGWGLARIDRGGARHVLECWAWDADPAEGSAGQYEGWPAVVDV